MWPQELDGLLKDYSCFLRRGVYRGFFTGSSLLVEVLPPPTVDQSSPGVNAACRLREFPFTSPRKDGPIGPTEGKMFSLLSQELCEPGNERSKASL